MLEWLDELTSDRNWYFYGMLVSVLSFGVLIGCGFAVRWATGHMRRGEWFPARGVGEGPLVVAGVFGMAFGALLWPLGWALVVAALTCGLVWLTIRAPHRVRAARQAKLQRQKDAKFRELESQVKFWKGLLSDESTDPVARNNMLVMLQDLHHRMSELT
jgi:hypothetical protein